VSRKASLAQARTAQLLRVQALLFGVPLAATRSRIEQVVDAIGPRLLGQSRAADTAIEVPDYGIPTIDQIEVLDGVAIVPLCGTFAPRAGAYDAMSGMVSYEDAVALLQAVDQRTDVRGLVLAIDSPGGAVAGVTEAAQAIAQIGKPVYAVADYQATSAAYWLASQADRLYVPPTGMVGSIGVYAVRIDATKADAQMGVGYDFIASGARKGDGDPHKPVSAAELADLQRMVDDSFALFAGSVAKARGLDVAAIRALEGAVLQGADAIAQGLADQLGTVGDAVAAMQAQLARSDQRRRRMTPSYAAAVVPQSKEAAMSTDTKFVATEAAALPSNVVAIDEKKIRDEATAQATAAMQARTEDIVGLCALARCPERATAFLADATMTAAAVRKLLAEEATAADAESAVTNHTNACRAGDGSGPTIDSAAIYARRIAGYQQARERRAQQRA
jgi:signal peptide peptidase SppA